MSVADFLKFQAPTRRSPPALVADAAGLAQTTIAVPNNPGLLGFVLHCQDFVLDTSLTSTIPLVVSNRGTAFVGL